MGHPQGHTPIQTDNSTANGIPNNTIKQQRSRAIDIRYHWVNDLVKQGHFHIFWAPVSTNLAEYYPKHLSAYHHKCIHPLYVCSVADYSKAARMNCEGVLNPDATSSWIMQDSAQTGPPLACQPTDIPSTVSTSICV